MWKDPVEKRFFWAKMERELERLLYELVKAEEEEDTGVYLLMMHYDQAGGKIPFFDEEREKIRRGLQILITDSKKHQKLLQQAIRQLKKEVRP